MSVPPLVCSTPPPPDQVEEEGYNDEFSFNYADLSPTRQFEDREYSPYDNVPSPRDTKVEDKIYITSSNVTFQEQEVKINNSSSLSNDDQIPTVSNDETINNISNEMETSGFSEDCNVEDLNLKVDSLNIIEFENDRVTVEDSLNSTFDDFGTFLTSTDFIPKIENSFCESDKESKSQGTCSEESASLHNEDWDNISQNSFNTNSNTIPDQDEMNYVKKDNNDNIAKDILTLDSPCDNLTAANKEESVDSGFKSSINDSNDQINNILKQDQFDNDNSITDVSTNTVSFSEFNDLDIKCNKVEKDIDEISIDNVKDCQIHNSSENFTTFIQQNDEFEANFNDAEDDDKFDSFVEAKPNLSEYIDANTNNVELEFSDTNESEEFGAFTDFESKDLNKFDNTDIPRDSHDTEDDDFNDFANFNDFSETKHEEDKSVDSNSQESIPKIEKDTNVENHMESGDDDFGDFDTYDPNMTSGQTKENEISAKSSAVNDLVLKNDTEIMDVLKNAVATIYHEDSLSDQSESDYELMLTLGSSWKHLGEYETKQSYLFPWNNSTSQKTLLKSLGIDSRNILFGPKWNTNMPRFAANLGASPLQPIKQTFPQHSSDSQQDKPSSTLDMDEANNYSQLKLPDWQSDNFSMGDSQASSYAESLLLDLEHLMATLDQMTSGQSPHFKISDLFSNACNEREDDHNVSKSNSVSGEAGIKLEKHQPPSILNIGRKINLPDTHIFTPTDSETPWSHTIHYQDNSSNFTSSNIDETFPAANPDMTQSNQTKTDDDFDDFQSHDVYNHSEPIKQQSKSDLQQFPVDDLEMKVENIAAPSKIPPNNDFDEFGDFHSATTVEAVVHHSEIVQPTSLLQPTRVTPSVSVPVVNWPAPGDVDTSVFEQLSDLPTLQPTLPSWIENKEQPSWIPETKEKSISFDPKDLHIPPFVPKVFPPGPTCLILKETKIDSVVTNDLPIEEDVGVAKNTVINSDLDDFTDFQSVTPMQVTNHNPKQPYMNTITTTHITNNTNEDIFQAANFNPIQSKTYQFETTSFISTPQMPNYFLPSTLGESFIKSDNFHAMNSTPFQRFDETPKQQNQQQQQILQPLSLENFSHINWPNPGMDIQDLSRFNPVNSIQSFIEPKETKVNNFHSNNDDDGWSDFVSVNQPIKHFQQQNQKSNNVYSTNNQQQNEEDDWSDFMSGTVSPSRSINSISQNIHSQINNIGNSSGTYNRNNITQQNLIKNPQYPNVAQSLTAVPNLSYVSSKINGKSNFQNL